MEQLTKGTNTLDLNLSDYAGVSSELVQNGGFDEIGADVITNGDFSATPLGSELVVDGNFPTPNVNWELVDGWSIEDNKLIADGTQANYAYQHDVFEIGVNKSYKITLTVSDYVSGYTNIVTSAWSGYTPVIDSNGD